MVVHMRAASTRRDMLRLHPYGGPKCMLHIQGLATHCEGARVQIP